MTQDVFRHALQTSCALSAAWLLTAPTPQASADPTGECDEGTTELEGAVSQLEGTCPDRRFKVGETKVFTQADTRYDDGACSDIAGARRLEAKGTLGADGTLTACKIGFGDDNDDNDDNDDSDSGDDER